MISPINDTSRSSASNYCKYNQTDDDVEIVAKRSLYVVLIFLGILFNVFVILISIKYTRRNSLYHFILNMVVSDAFFLVVVFIDKLWWLSDYKLNIYNEMFGDIMCKTKTFLMETLLRVSLITLLVISVGRFKATRRTLQRPRPYTLKQRALVLGACWLIPMTVAFCYSYITEFKHLEYGYCRYPTKKLRSNYFILSFLMTADVLTLCICFLIFVLSILTTRQLSRPQAIQNHLTEEQRNTREYRTRAAVRMVLVSVALYTGCWLPDFVFRVWFFVVMVVSFASPSLQHYSACIDWNSLEYIIFMLFPVVNACFSPCIYTIFLPEYQQAAKKVLCQTETRNQNPSRINPAIKLHAVPNPALNYEHEEEGE